jgi:hypothetical protein
MSTRSGKIAQPENQMTCSTMESTAPATMSHENHCPGTLQRRRAAAARSKNMADVIARMGVSVFSRSPCISVRVSTAKGQSSLPPTHQGAAESPTCRGTIPLRLSCAPSSNRTRITIHIRCLLSMNAAIVVAHWQTFLREQPNSYYHPRRAGRILLYGAYLRAIQVRPPTLCGLLIEVGSSRMFQAVCAPMSVIRLAANLPLLNEETHQEPKHESLPDYLPIAKLFQKFQDLLFRPRIAVKHQRQMTTFFHWDEFCPWDIPCGKLCLLEGDQCVVTCM